MLSAPQSLARRRQAEVAMMRSRQFAIEPRREHLLARWPMQVLNASTFEQQSLLAVNNHEDQ
jgi:hypothetical protein